MGLKTKSFLISRFTCKISLTVNLFSITCFQVKNIFFNSWHVVRLKSQMNVCFILRNVLSVLTTITI